MKNKVGTKQFVCTYKNEFLIKLSIPKTLACKVLQSCCATDIDIKN